MSLTQIQTTGLADAAVTEPKLATGVTTVTATSHTLTEADAGSLLILDNAAAITLTVQANATEAIDIGTRFEIAQGGDGVVTVAGAQGVTVETLGAEAKTAGRNAVATLVKRSTDGWLLFGSGAEGASSSASSGGALVHLATQTASNSASLDFASGIDSTYDNYVLYLNNVISTTDGSEFWLRTSTNGGSSYDSGASDYAFGGIRANSGTTISSPTFANSASHSIRLSRSDAGSDTNENGASGWVVLHRPSVSHQCQISWRIVYVTQGGALEIVDGGGRRSAVADVDAVQFLFNNGNVESGVIRLYGLKDG